jgi:hypothetical protein
VTQPRRARAGTRGGGGRLEAPTWSNLHTSGLHHPVWKAGMVPISVAEAGMRGEGAQTLPGWGWGWVGRCQSSHGRKNPPSQEVTKPD